MKLHKLFKGIVVFLLLTSLLASVFFTYSIFNNQNTVKSTSDSLITGKKTDKEKISTLAKFVSNIETTNVAYLTLSDYANMGFDRAFWALFYKSFPKNIIPPDVVLKYNLSYTGPCGAKARLFCSMIKSVGYSCRLLSVPAHTMAEVKIDDIWTPVDPTFGIYFESGDGSLASTDVVKNDTKLFSETVLKFNLSYPVDNPDWQIKNYRSKNNIKEELADTILYMEPYYLLSFLSISAFLFFTILYRHIFLNSKR